MERNILFTFRVNIFERKEIEDLSDYLQRSKSDSIRYLIRKFLIETIQKENEVMDEKETKK